LTNSEKPPETGNPPPAASPSKGKKQRVTYPEQKPPKEGESGKPRESKVHRLTQGKKPYTPPPKPEIKKPRLLTVEQYLRKANQDEGISDLIRSMHRTKIQSLQDWEREAAALIKRQVK